MSDTTKRVNLSQRMIFNERLYGPGDDIEVPVDFPEPGSIEEQPGLMRVTAKPLSSSPNTGGVNTGENLSRIATGVPVVASETSGKLP